VSLCKVIIAAEAKSGWTAGPQPPEDRYRIVILDARALM
jgi:hypothetical protein